MIKDKGTQLEAYERHTLKKRAALIVAALAAIAAALFSAGVGSITIPAWEIVKTIFGAGDAQQNTVIWGIRLPRVTAAILVGAMLAKNAFRELKAFGDADDVGGAPLLGINGICIIGHGSSSPKAVRNAIRVAGECVTFGLNERITARLNATGSNTAELEHELADAKK